MSRPIRAVRRSAGRRDVSGARYRLIRNDSGAPTRIDVYDDIGGGGWFGGGITPQDIVDQLAEIDGDVEVHVNSGGGDVFDGIAIFNALAQRPGNVTTIVDGIAASIASVIVQAGKTRVVAPGAMMMIHDALSVCFGNASEMRDTADLLDQVSDNIASVYASRSGTAKAWRDAMETETWYSADGAVEAGLADELAKRPAKPEDVAAHDFSKFARVPAWLQEAAARNAAAPHGPMAGTHAHPHPAYGSQGGDASHEHEHAHDGDASHGHSHAGGSDENGEGAQDRAPRQPAAVTTPARVLGIESMPLANKAIAVHHTATADEAWDGPAAVAAMPAEYADLHYCHGWQDAEADSSSHTPGDDDADDKKGNFKFPHHKTEGGPANLAACRNGLARLPGADIPAGDDAGVKAHLQAHLDDGSKDDGTDDHANTSISAADAVERYRAALKGARA